MAESSIKTKAVGFGLVEIHEVTVNLSTKDRKAFESAPERVIARLLRKGGHRVNRVLAVRTTTRSRVTRARRRDIYFHIVYPPNERSGWICA